jgi:hypothetical protein
LANHRDREGAQLAHGDAELKIFVVFANSRLDDTFGLGKMNPKTYARELKPSAYFYRDTIRRGGVKNIPGAVARAARRSTR